MKSILLLLLLAPWSLSPLRAETLGDVLEITPPPGWVHDVKASRSPMPTAEFRPKATEDRKILVTLLPSSVVRVTDGKSLRRFLDLAAKPFLPRRDAKVEAKEIPGAKAPGFYATFEDPALVGKPARPGEYKVATEAVLFLAPDYVVQTTIFSESTSSTAIDEGLQMMAAAFLKSPDGASRPPPAVAEKPESSQAAGIEVRVPNLSVGLRIPAGRFSELPKANSNPGYFIFGDDRGITLSGWLDGAAGFPGMRTFWPREKSSLEKGGFTVQDERMKLIAGWNAVTYLVPVGDGVVQKHIRACRVVAETWIDLHISTTNPNGSWDDLEATLKAIEILRLESGPARSPTS